MPLRRNAQYAFYWMVWSEIYSYTLYRSHEEIDKLDPRMRRGCAGCAGCASRRFRPTSAPPRDVTPSRAPYPRRAGPAAALPSPPRAPDCDKTLLWKLGSGDMKWQCVCRVSTPRTSRDNNRIVQWKMRFTVMLNSWRPLIGIKWNTLTWWVLGFEVMVQLCGRDTARWS